MPQFTKDIKQDSTNLFLFVGPADAGKSYAATSFGLMSKEYGGEDPRPCYMLELDGRLTALRNRPIQFDAYTNEDGAVGVLKRVIELRNNTIRDKVAPFHTLIFDSATTYGDFSVADSLDVTTTQNELNKANKTPLKGRIRGELSQLTVEDYGYEAESFRQLLWENLLDLKKYCHVIVIAHEVPDYKTVKGSPGEPTRSEPNGYKLLMHGNKIAARLPTKFDEIYHFPKKEIIISTKSVRRTVIFQDDLARSAYPELAKSTESHDITNKEFYTYWKSLISKDDKANS